MGCGAITGVRGWVWGVGCGAFRDKNCKVGDKVETLCLSSGLFQRILRINQEHASENGKKIMGNFGTRIPLRARVTCWYRIN